MMLGWLGAFCLFWVVSSLYLGGMDVELEGGSGFRQLLGLLVMNVLFLVAWRALAAAIGGLGGVPGVVLPYLATVLLVPLLARGAFGVMGVKLSRGGGAHAH
ncbi:MAG: hypothetical protein P8Y10_01705 [Gemmatimonadales bacterium]|jgi:hypothetical protein